MIRKQKEAVINELAANLGKGVVAITTDYRGMSAKEMVTLRRLLHAQGVEYRVVKNTLMHLAAEKSGASGLDQFLVGPMAVAISYDDVVKPAKILTDHIKAANSVLKIKGGILGAKVLTAADVARLAAIPSKEILISQLLGRMKSPISSLHFVLSSPLRGLVVVLQARARQLEVA